MHNDPNAVVRAIYQAWIRQDLDSVLEHFADDAAYTLHIDDEAVPTGGRAIGQAHIRGRLERHLEIFEQLLYRPGPLTTDGGTVRTRIEYWYRHRASAHDINGYFRHVWVISEGRVVSIDEYHDAAKFAAFMRLVAETPARSGE